MPVSEGSADAGTPIPTAARSTPKPPPINRSATVPEMFAKSDIFVPGSNAARGGRPSPPADNCVGALRRLMKVVGYEGAFEVRSVVG